MTTFNTDIEIRHSLRNLTRPVGYLAPDGRWFLIESDDSGLAHLFLSDYVYDEYKGTIEDNHIFASDHESYLELAGFIKVHETYVRYYAQRPYGGYYNRKECCKTPKVNDIQRERLCEYAQLFGYDGIISINDTYNEFSAYQLRQMDYLALQKAFRL